MDNLMNFLCNYAFDHKIGYQLDSIGFKPDEPSVSNGTLKFVVINTGWKNSNEIPFQFAHEISHVLNGDIGINKFPVNPTLLKEEFAANKRAMNILLEYCDLNKIHMSSAAQFMISFGIPTYLYDLVNEVMNNFYGIKYDVDDEF